MAQQTQQNLRVHGVKMRLSRLFEINLMMTFYSLLVPGDLFSGGVGYLKISSEGESKSSTLAAILTNRWINTLLLFSMGTLLVQVDRTTTNIPIKIFLWAGTLSFAAVYVAASVFKPPPEFARNLTLRFSIPSSWVERLLRIWDEFHAMKRSEHLHLFMFGVLIQLAGIASHISIVEGLDIPLDWLTVGWVRSLVMIISLIPFSVGGFGLREGSLIYLLSLYMIENETAIAYSFLIVGSVYITGLLGGLVQLKDLIRKGPVEKTYGTS